MEKHIKPLYIDVHIFGRPIKLVLVDNGVAINIMLPSIKRELSKGKEDLLEAGVLVTNLLGDSCKPGVIVGSSTAGNPYFYDCFLIIEAVFITMHY